MQFRGRETGIYELQHRLRNVSSVWLTVVRFRQMSVGFPPRRSCNRNVTKGLPNLTMKHLRLIVLGSIVAFVCAAASVSASVTWSSDSPANFAFTLSGTGPTWGPGNLVSPSGLWDFTGGGDVELFGGTSRLSLTQGGMGVEFVTSASLDDFPGYGDLFAASGVVRDGNTLDPILNTPQSPFFGWSGRYGIQYDIPDPQNSSTWSWTMQMSGSGPALTAPAVNVPEPGSLLLVGFGLMALPVLHRLRR